MAGSHCGQVLWAEAIDLPAETSLNPVFVSLTAANNVGLKSSASLSITLVSEPPLLSAGVLTLVPPVAFPPSAGAAAAIMFLNTSAVALQCDAALVSDNLAQSGGVTSLTLTIDDGLGFFYETHAINASGGAALIEYTAVPHRQYHVYLRAISRAGYASTTELVVFYDPTAPTGGRVRVCGSAAPLPLEADAWVQPSGGAITLCPSQFKAPLSGIVAYRVVLTDDATGAELHTADVPLVDGFLNLTGLALSCLSRIRIDSQALSGAGVAGKQQTNLLDVACAAPSITIPVIEEPNGRASPSDLLCLPRSASLVRVSWLGDDERPSHLGWYRAALRKGSEGEDGGDGNSSTHAAYHDVRTRTSELFDTLALDPAPATYVAQVQACDTVGHCAMTSSNDSIMMVDSPPAGGSVNLTAVAVPAADGAVKLRRFLTNRSSISGAWSGFTDSSTEAGAAPLSYEACVGTMPLGCQLLSMHATSAPNLGVPLPTIDVSLRCGGTYYLSVRSTNCAGLSTTVTSEGATLCCHSPRQGNVHLLDSQFEQVGTALDLGGAAVLPSLSISWEGFSDSCSGVAQYTVALDDQGSGSRLFERSVSNLTRSSSTDRSGRRSAFREALPLDVVKKLPDKIRVSVEAINFLGLSSKAIVDITVSREALTVAAPEFRWNLAEEAWHTNESCLAADAASVEVRWPRAMGGAGSLSYLVAHSSADSPSLLEWLPVGVARMVRYPAAELTAGGSTRFKVRACDTIGQCVDSAWSAVLHRIVDKPDGDEVRNVTHVHPATAASPGFITQGSGLAVQWPSFSSLFGPITFDVCVGTTPLGCQVQRFVPSPSDHSWNSSTLPYCGATYYVAVRATNCAGLQRVEASPGVMLCCDAPLAGLLSLWGHGNLTVSGKETYVSNSTTQLTATWSGFVGGCGGVREYELTLHAASDGAQLWSSGLLGADQTSLEMPWVESLRALLGQDDGEYTATLRATSHAGLSTTAEAKLAVVATLPRSPAPQELHAVLSSGRRTPISSVLLGSASTEVFCVPMVGELAADSIEIRWDALVDSTAIVRAFASYYAVVPLDSEDASSSDPQTLPETAWQTGTSSQVVAMPTRIPRLSPLATVPMSTCSQAYCAVAARTCDVAGLCSYSSWTVLAPIKSVPTAGMVDIRFFGGGVSDGFIGPTGFGVSWSGFATTVGAVAFDVCVGTTPLGCQVQRFVPSPSDHSWNSSTLPYCGATYYVAVRATNCAGLQRVEASPGVMLCCDAPLAGLLSLWGHGNLTVSGKETYVSNSTTQLTATWSGFVGGCGGVREYELTLHAASDGAQLWSSGLLGADQTSLEMPWVESLRALLGQDDGEYTATLRATSHAGLSTTAEAKLVLDAIPPSLARVFSGEQGDVACRRAGLPATLTWSGLADAGSGIASVEWAIGSAPLASDVKPFGPISIEDAGSVPRTWGGGSVSPAMHTIYNTLRVSDRAGNSVFGTSSGVRIVPDGGSDHFVCVASGEPANRTLQEPHSLFSEGG